MVPVYILTGFIDAGKTTAARDLIYEMQKADYKKTLLIVCEQGEEEYDRGTLDDIGVTLKYIENESDMEEDLILELELEVRPERIIVEYNGMWNADRPKVIWDPEQILEIMLIDTSTFEMYLGNLKSMIAGKIRSADLIIFGRCEGEEDKLSMYRRSARALNRNANIVFRNEDGEIRFDPGAHLPYDADADVIEIDDDTFAAFYIDSMEDPDRYVGKEIRFSGIILNSRKQEEHSFIVGRIALTCCSEDMTVFGFICDTKEECPYITDEWVDVICVMDKEYSEKYDIWHPVCKVRSLKPSAEEHKKVINVT